MTPTNPTDPEAPPHVVAAAVAGDRRAFADLYRTYQPLVGRIVGNRIRGIKRCDKEDLVADVFAKALANIHRYRDRGVGFGAWLVTITVNTVNDYHRSACRRETPGDVLIDAETTPDPSPGPADTVLTTVDRLHTFGTVRVAITTLTAAQRLCLTLRYIHDLSVSDAAIRMDTTPGAVKALHCRAIRTLQRALTTQHGQ